MDAQLDGASLDAAPSITVSGQITQIDPSNFASHPVPNLPVELRSIAGDALLASGTTDASGGFGLTATSGGAPIVGYVHAMGKVVNALDAYYFVRPLTGDATLSNFVVFTQQGIDLLATFYGVPMPSPQSALVFTFVTGPDGAGKAGLAIQATPGAGAVRYFDAQGNIPDASLTATSSSGIAVVFDVPPASIQFSASQDGQQLATYDLTAPAMSTSYVPLVVP